MEQPIYWTVAEAAEALRMSESYLYKEGQSGRIPGIKYFGRAVRFHRETLVQWGRDEAKADRQLKAV